MCDEDAVFLSLSHEPDQSYLALRSGVESLLRNQCEGGLLHKLGPVQSVTETGHGHRFLVGFEGCDGHDELPEPSNPEL